MWKEEGKKVGIADLGHEDRKLKNSSFTPKRSFLQKRFNYSFFLLQGHSNAKHNAAVEKNAEMLAMKLSNEDPVGRYGYPDDSLPLRNLEIDLLARVCPFLRIFGPTLPIFLSFSFFPFGSPSLILSIFLSTLSPFVIELGEFSRNGGLGGLRCNWSRENSGGQGSCSLFIVTQFAFN